MGTRVPLDDLPTIEHAIAAEGASPQVADLARSIYQQESSSGKNTKTSNAGAVGGMQIRPATFNGVADKGWGIDNPEHNARAGVRYLALLNDKAGGDPALTAAGYYGGPGAINKAKQGIAVSDPRNPNAPNTLQYGQQVAARLPTANSKVVPQSDLPVSNSSKLVPQDDLPDEFKTGTGTRFTPAQLAQAKNPPSFTQDLQKELADNPIKAKMAAAGTALTDMLNGGKQLIGMDSPQVRTDIRDQRTISDANKGSAFAGNASLYALGGLAPVLNTVKGAAIGGAAIGALAPTEQDSVLQAKLGSALVGAGTGAAGAKIGQALVNSLANKTAANAVAKSQNATADATLKASQEAGYFIPPATTNPTMLNRNLESIAGKAATQQDFTVKNAEVTNSLAKKYLGLPNNVSLSSDVLEGLKAELAAPYKEAASLPSGIVGQSSSKSMATGNKVTNDIVKTGNQLVEELKDTRLNSKDSWNEFKRTGSAAAKRTANALDDHVDTLESQLEKLATDNGKPDLVDSLRGARKDIAKVHSVDRAMNDATGNVNAQDFANQWNKNVPLTGEAKTIADFGNAYKKVSGKVENIGSQGVSKLKFGLATLLGTAGAATTGGLGATAAAIPFIAPDAAKLLLSSKLGQSLAKKSYDVGILPKALSTLRYAPMAIAGTAVKSLSK